jgi:hypothetical protein
MAVWYLENDGTHGWSAVAQWAALTAYTVGNIIRQLATPAVNSERCFVCVVAGTSLAAEPTWTLTKGATTAESLGPTWKECTGQASVNGDTTNTPVWTAATNYALTSPIVKNTAASHYFIVTTDAGSSGASEPSWNTTTGATTTDSGITWTCIGAVGAFSGYGAPHARILTAAGSSWMEAGDTLYVSDRHAESGAGASLEVTIQGTVTAPCKVLCVDHTNIPPTTLATTATVSNSGGNYFLFLIGYAYIYGVAFSAGTHSYGIGIQFFTSGEICVDSCTFNTSSGKPLNIGNASATSTYYSKIEFKNCTVSFGNASSIINIGSESYINISNLTLTGTAPTSVFNLSGGPNTGYSHITNISDSNLSIGVTSLMSIANARASKVILTNVRLGSGVAITTGTFNPINDGIYLYNCDSGNTNYTYNIIKYGGTVAQDLTTIRTGGASDGTTAVSWKFVTNANNSFALPMVSDPISIWNETTGSSLTATVEIAGAATVNDDDIWMEIEYLGDASYCTGSVVSNRRALLAAPAAVTSSSAAWGGSPAHTQKLQCTFTPQKKGPVVARIYVGKASATIYVDPMITIT